jgi:AmmeMemoRadiSam system protein B/AmmeMemoRadiSam system protein A
MAMFSSCTSGRVRQPAVAGQFYSADAKKLESDVDSCFLAARKQTPIENLAAIIVPHAGYVFSGNVAATAMAAINPDAEYEHIFLIGPSHHVYLDSTSVNVDYEAYRTPLGDVPVDIALGKKLIADNPNVFTCSPKAHSSEHCLEVQLPFLQRHLKKMPPIVPIIIASQDWQVIKNTAAALQPYFNKKNLFVISSDFSHYPNYKDANRVDKITADSILTGDPIAFVSALKSNNDEGVKNLATSACGQSAILALLFMCRQAGNIEINKVAYENSGDTPLYGEKDRVVGYNAFTFSRKEAKKTNIDFTLTDKEKSTLLKIARRAITDKFSETEKYKVPDSDITPTLKLSCGAFVTLTENGRLRGCIGMLRTDDPLYVTIHDMAVSAAFHDPRFYPMTSDEASHITIEISVLSPLKQIKDISEFTLHKDGIFMVKGGRSGTFLPQVADEVNWTAEEFFGHCSRDKAGFGWDGWRDADLYTYEAVVFKEH